MKEIFLLRHGATGQTGRYTGSSDIALSLAGREQILKQMAFLSSLTFTAVYCSPLKRCRQSGDLLGMPTPTIDRRLAEIDFGEWEGKTFDEIVSRCPDLVEQWRLAEQSFRFPGGESIAGFRRRIDDFASAMHVLPAGRILVIAHGGVIRHLLCRFLGLPYASSLCFRPQCGTFAVVELYDGGGVLTGFNLGGETWRE